MIQLLDATTVPDGIPVALMSAPGFFEYVYSVVSLQPYKIAASRSHRLTVTGTDFSTEDKYYCKVTLYGRSKQSELVSPDSDTTLVCVLPGKANANACAPDHVCVHRLLCADVISIFSPFVFRVLVKFCGCARY